MITLYNGGRRTKKWWKRVFFHGLECAQLNAYILFDHSLGKNSPLLQFKISLSQNLIGATRLRKQIGRPRTITEDDRLVGGDKHIPLAIRGGGHRDCVVCSKKSSKGS